MNYISSGEAIGSRRTPLIFARKLGDLVDTPNVKNVKRGMSTQTLKYGYAFSDPARNTAIRRLFRRLSNEISTATPARCPDAADDDCTADSDYYSDT